MKKRITLEIKIISLFIIFFLFNLILISISLSISYIITLNNEEEKIVNYSNYIAGHINFKLNSILENLELLGSFKKYDYNILNSFISEKSLISDIIVMEDNNIYKKNGIYNFQIDIQFFKDLKNYSEIQVDNNLFLTTCKTIDDKKIILLTQLKDSFFVLENIYSDTNFLWEIIIVNKKGLLLYDSNSDISDTQNRDYSHHPSVKSSLLGKTGFNLIKTDKKYFYATSQFINNLDWIIIIKSPQIDLIRKIITLMFPNFAIISFILFFIIIFLTIFLRIIIEPIKKLSDQIKNYNTDNTFSSDYKNNDEIGDVISAFRNMVLERKKLENEILQISENERTRIGRDLHDDLGQILTGISFQMILMKDKLCDNTDGLNIYNDTVKLVSDAIGKTKLIARGLCPVNLMTNGIVDFLSEMIKNYQNIYNINFVLDLDTNIDIFDEILSSNIYHICMESINNAIKHSNCSEIIITLKYLDNYILLSIKDNGIGILEYQNKGMGLKIMKYRANIIKSKLDIINIKDSGTEIKCLIPKNREVNIL